MMYILIQYNLYNEKIYLNTIGNYYHYQDTLHQGKLNIVFHYI